MFKKIFTVVIFIVTTASSPLFSVAAAEGAVRQSSRSVPVAHEVDLLVLGGTTGGVAAACEASRAGARVLLLTPYPYLGEDRTATLRLSGESDEEQSDPLARLLLDDPNRDQSILGPLFEMSRSPDRLPLTYRIDGKIDRTHPEIEPPGRLGDGMFGDSVNDSLQINGDATITVDLGAEKEVAHLVLATYRRLEVQKPFQVESVTLRFGDDGKNWKEAEAPFREDPPLGNTRDDYAVPFTLRLPSPVTARYLELRVSKSRNCDRMLLGELIVLAKPFEQGFRSEPDAVRPPRPMHVKQVLDNALLQEKIPFLFNTFPVGDICDAGGNRFGVVIANRSGRQAVLAKKILDVRPQVDSLEKAQFVVIGAKPRTVELEKYPALKSVSHELIGEPFVYHRKRTSASGENLGNEYPIVNYTFRIDVPAGTKTDDIEFRAKIEKQIRLATYSPDQAFTADEIHYPQPFKPLSFWRKRGRDLAAEATRVTMPSPERLSVVSKDITKDATKGEATVSGDIREVLKGLRKNVGGVVGEEKAIADPQRSLPVIGRYDVVVVGGGTSGAPAGIGAGRRGAKTLVLEHLHDLGGIGTAGAISVYWYGNVTGFTREVQEGLRRWTIESKIHWWRSKLAEAGTDVWYGVLAYGALVDDDRVKGVLVATPFGAGIVEAKFVIDATGNGDIAVAAGANTHFIDDKEIAVQGAGLAPRNLGASYTNTDFMFVDDGDILDSSHVFVYAKEKYPKAFDQGKLLSTRERRQILGEFSFTVLDQINNRTYPDSIVYGYSDYDTHGYTIDPYMELNHPYTVKTRPDGKRDRTDRLYAYVPYRSSIPIGLDGILVVGLAMSCHRDALPIVRMQPDLQNQGYAVGCAAAMLSKKEGAGTRDLDVRALQEHLVEIGNLEPVVLTQEDNYGKTLDRLPEAVRTLPLHFRESVPLVMWYPEQARPLVHKAYLDADDFETKLVFAKVAAALGDNIGVPSILQKLASYTEWDKGWNFKGMGQAGAATSPLDQWIMMLGRTKDSRALDEIVRKAKMLTHESEFSHLRAVALALENIGGEKAARTLAELLDRPGMTGYVHDSIEKAKKFDQEAGRENTNQEKARRDSLIEISLARALYRCGDIDGKGEAILRAYTKDLRGHFARHAAAVLESGLSK